MTLVVLTSGSYARLRGLPTQDTVRGATNALRTINVWTCKGVYDWYYELCPDHEPIGIPLGC
jgi:hypothetical protein